MGADHTGAEHGRGEEEDTDHTAGSLTVAQVEAFESELMHAQWMVGVLDTLGGDTAAYAAEIGEIARRGADLLAGRVAQ